MMNFHGKRGFSLLELIIVLGVLGVLLAGLFQLTSASTRQINAQIAAQQLQQWIKGYKAYVFGRTDANGYSFPTYGGGCVAATPDRNFPAPNGPTQDVTGDVQCFRQSSLPTVAPNGGTYHVYMTRLNDVGNYGSYQISATIVGGTNYDDNSAGSVAGYVGAEGATFYPGGIDADDPATSCNEAADSVRSAFGATCTNNGLGGYTPYAPSTLSFLSIIDVGTSDSNFLWRVPGASPDLNKMTVDQGMMNEANLIWDGTPIVPGAGDGDIAMAGGSITGVRHLKLETVGSRTVIGIDTNGGYISTQNGDLALGSGDMSTTGDMTAHAISVTNASVSNSLSGFDGTFQDTLSALSFYYTSDMRLKHDIVQLPDALAKLLKIRGVSFKWNKDGKPDIGVIAQEVQAVYPEAVSSRMIDGQERLTVETGNLVGPLIEAIRALKAQNDDLRDQLAALRRDVDTLKGQTK